VLNHVHNTDFSRATVVVYKQEYPITLSMLNRICDIEALKKRSGARDGVFYVVYKRT